MLQFRKTLFGRLSYYFGKVLAIIFLVRMVLSARRVVYRPKYEAQVYARYANQML